MNCQVIRLHVPIPAYRDGVLTQDGHAANGLLQAHFKSSLITSIARCRSAIFTERKLNATLYSSITSRLCTQPLHKVGVPVFLAHISHSLKSFISRLPSPSSRTSGGHP